MMQSLLFLNSPESGEIDRIINIDLLSTACVHNENPEWTRLICGFSDITIHIKLADFVEKVKELVAANYKVSLQNSAYWHEKRMQDMQTVMGKVLNG
jgi:hypothetical protein